MNYLPRQDLNQSWYFLIMLANRYQYMKSALIPDCFLDCLPASALPQAEYAERHGKRDNG